MTYADAGCATPASNRNRYINSTDVSPTNLALAKFHLSDGVVVTCHVLLDQRISVRSTLSARRRMLPKWSSVAADGPVRRCLSHQQGDQTQRSARVREAQLALQALSRRQRESQPAAALSATGTTWRSAARLGRLVWIASNVSHVCLRPVPASADYFCAPNSLSPRRRFRLVGLSSNSRYAGHRAAATTRRRRPFRVSSAPGDDAAAGDDPERSASTDGSGPASDSGSRAEQPGSGDARDGRRPGGRSRGPASGFGGVRWPGSGSDGGGVGASGEYGQSTWAKMMISLPLEVAAAASRSDSHYLQKRKRKQWWSSAEWPKVCCVLLIAASLLLKPRSVIEPIHQSLSCDTPRPRGTCVAPGLPWTCPAQVLPPHCAV